MNRYKKQSIMQEIGIEGQSLISNANVAIVGVGGLGSSVLQNLVGAGIGTITIIDDDKVSIDNLHRQLIYKEDEIGLPKVLAAAGFAKQLNSEINVIGKEIKLTKINAKDLLFGHDVIVDCTDSIKVRYIIDSFSKKLDIPFVHAAIHKFQGQLSVFNYKSGPSYKELYEQEDHTNPGCDEVGTLSIVTSVMGALQANEVIKILINSEYVLAGKLAIYDLLNNTTKTFSLKTNYGSTVEKILNKLPKPIIMEISPAELAEKLFLNQNFQIIDIRDENSEPPIYEMETTCIPFHDIERAATELNNEHPIVLVCQNGNKSKAAVQLIKKSNPSLDVYSLEGGVAAIINQDVKELA